ncbi:hypothetical protein JCM11491_000940 [Sporobolomyces phaffii]
MLNPTTLFVACLLTLAANPSFVASIPLPPLPHRSPSTTLRHRAFKSTRKLPILRIVEDDLHSESASWTQAFAEDSLPESIFVHDERARLSQDLDISSVHRPHNLRRGQQSPPSQRAVAQTARSRREKRSPSEPNRKHSKNQKRFSSRWLRGQAAASRRASEAAAKTSASSPSIVWTKVSTTSRSFAPRTTAEILSSTSNPLPSSTPSPSATAPAASSGAPSLSGTHSGDGTWFAPGLGACGTVATDDSPIVAVSHLLYDSFPGATVNPNLNPICGKQIRATYRGKSVDVTVQDRCEGCAMWDLDFSPTLFGDLADLDVGRLHGVEWVFI